MRRNWPREGRQLRRRIWPPSRGPNPTQFRARPSRVCVRKLRVLRRIFVGSLSPRRGVEVADYA